MLREYSQERILVQECLLLAWREYSLEKCLLLELRKYTRVYFAHVERIFMREYLVLSRGENTCTGLPFACVQKYSISIKKTYQISYTAV